MKHSNVRRGEGRAVSESNVKVRVVESSMLTSLLLIFLKGIAAFLTGSVGVFS